MSRCQILGCRHDRTAKLDLGGGTTLGLCVDHLDAWRASGDRARACFQVAEWERRANAEQVNGHQTEPTP
jgi:hypothetical protein